MAHLEEAPEKTEVSVSYLLQEQGQQWAELLCSTVTESQTVVTAMTLTGIKSAQSGWTVDSLVHSMRIAEPLFVSHSSTCDGTHVEPAKHQDVHNVY